MTENSELEIAGAPVEPRVAMPLALDPRHHAYREDLADERLLGRVEAPRFVSGTVRQINRPAVALRRRPEPTLGLETEALFGEHVTMFDEADGWAWVQLHRDRYVGYVPATALSPHVTTPTHRVRSPGTFLYNVPDIKSPPMMHLSITSPLTIVEEGERFSRTHDGMFVISRHLTETNRYARDFVDVAESLEGVPYLWGGKTRVGLDCSGLVQLSLNAAGIDAPRDSDLQRKELGAAITVNDKLEGLQRGDLVFWNGHVGIMLDGVMLLHANAHHMATVVETLPEAAGRIERAGLPILAVKRLGLPQS